MTSPRRFSNKVVKFAGAVIRHAADGFLRAEDDVVAKREGLCNECPANRGGECDLCGCSIKLKITWRSERCPMELW